jgi:hypothetical protein
MYASDDLDRLADDPAFPASVWKHNGETVIDQRLASQPTQSPLIDILMSSPSNLEALREGLAGVQPNVDLPE